MNKLCESEWIGLTIGPLSSKWRYPLGEWRKVAAIWLSGDGRYFEYIEGDGIIINGKTRTVNLVSIQEFGDCEIYLEFCLPEGSNSGVYLMGRYEIQIYDSYQMDNPPYSGIECGGIYPRWIDNKNVGGRSPDLNVARAPGQWQSFNILFKAPRFDSIDRKVSRASFIEVRHNGYLIHKNVEVDGPTRASLFEDEALVGPLMLQGDHGPIAFRNIRIRRCKFD